METRSPLVDLAAVLTALAVLPGLALVVLGFRAFTADNDMLMPVIGMVGMAAIGAGAMLAAFAGTATARIATRHAGSRLPGIGLGAGGTFLGLMVQRIGGVWPWLLVLWGVTLAVLLCTPTARQELGPLLVLPVRPRRR